MIIEYYYNPEYSIGSYFITDWEASIFYANVIARTKCNECEWIVPGTIKE